MTTTWTITPEWKGEDVAVLASGPSLTAAAVAALRAQVTRVIVVNAAHQLAPWADMLVAADGNWPAAYRNFAGLRVTSVADDTHDARYIGPRWERVNHPTRGQIEIHNSGLTAVRVAALMGARRIWLLGFDHGEWAHFNDPAPADASAYLGVPEGLVQIMGELRAAGVPVEHFTPPVKKAVARG